MQSKYMGRAHEILAAACFDQCWFRMFPWVTDIRLATPEEDAQGKDVIVTWTDIGEIPVQVKSSRTYAAKHKRIHPDIPVLIVYPTHTEEEVRKNMAKLLRKERSLRDPSFITGSAHMPPAAPPPEQEPLVSSLGDLLTRRR